MSDTVIRVENLGKKYIIGHQQQERYTALRDVISNGVKGLLKPLGKGKAETLNREDFWALKDVSFEIKQGDRVGIIGRNGAGKSTLLKILSRITEPTEGRIQIKGRVASLLEVGTGFHPELTGRENIFLNGAILGMSKAEISRKFDEIVAFAEVEKFLDTPVKRYSSGMYVRLAFAVAAHLEPEILIVDEVLAVGDAQFQKKCLGKMEDVADKEGRTVLFVSHNMTAIQTLCNHAILLQKGQISSYGAVNQQIRNYLDSYKVNQGNIADESKLRLSSNLWLTAFRVTPNPLVRGDLLTVELQFASESNKEILIQHIAILLYNQIGVRVGILDLISFEASSFKVSRSKTCLIRTEVQSLPLVEGDYIFGMYILGDNIHKQILDMVTITLLPEEKQKGFSPAPPEHRGIVELEYDFRIEYSVIQDSDTRA